MNATIREFLAPGRAIAVGENKAEFRVSIPVNRIDLIPGVKIIVGAIRAVKKTIGVTKVVEGKPIAGLEKIEFVEAAIDFAAMEKAPTADKKY